MARAKKSITSETAAAAKDPLEISGGVPKPPTKMQRLIAALQTEHGATIPDLMEITGWQSHSVRGAIAGHVKRKLGLIVSSEKVGGERRYKIAAEGVE